MLQEKLVYLQKLWTPILVEMFQDNLLSLPILTPILVDLDKTLPKFQLILRWLAFLTTQIKLKKIFLPFCFVLYIKREEKKIRKKNQKKNQKKEAELYIR